MLRAGRTPVLRPLISRPWRCRIGLCGAAWLDNRLASPGVSSGAAKREAREKLLEAARRHEIYIVLVWRLDRWG